MNKYKVEIKETLSKVIEQAATSYEEAETLVMDKYKNEEITLYSEDYVDTEYKPYHSQKIKDNFRVNFTYDKKQQQLFIEDKRGCRNYSCEDTTDLKVLLREYFNNNIELEAILPEKVENKKKKGRER